MEKFCKFNEKDKMFFKEHLEEIIELFCLSHEELKFELSQLSEENLSKLFSNSFEREKFFSEEGAKDTYYNYYFFEFACIMKEIFDEFEYYSRWDDIHVSIGCPDYIFDICGIYKAKDGQLFDSKGDRYKKVEQSENFFKLDSKVYSRLKSIFYSKLYRYLKNQEKLFSKTLLEAYLRIGKMEYEKLGIPDISYHYHKVSEQQKCEDEFIKTENFLTWIVKNYPQDFNKEVDINFINYGDTELVYVVDEAGYKRTLLVGQPNIKFGIVKKEYENLKKLAKNNPDLVVSPINYYSNLYKEAYLTPYFYQARCIASSIINYGVYVPEPKYSFIAYNDEDTYTICKSIIASLILLYNQDEKLGLAACKVGGGDFILEKEYDSEPHTIENTLKRMHLVAARELISIDLDSYISLLKNEFSKETYYEKIIDRDPNILINHKNRLAMPKDAIYDGIQLGLKLKK